MDLCIFAYMLKIQFIYIHYLQNIIFFLEIYVVGIIVCLYTVLMLYFAKTNLNKFTSIQKKYISSNKHKIVLNEICNAFALV